ncbi:AAA family ATPase [Psychrobium sp. nBUS_13]|uniref:AAA family ATPase n=1 Tax=Psychrobium sp. nBUS_13 TaxID=3395319 RepID=UPI003EBA0752
MVDERINRQGSMDVVLNVQEQLISRIALACKDSNKMTFLHGISGVGKTHIANRLQDSLSASLVISMSLKSTIQPEQLKQQLICELVTDELTDLNQPIAKAVYQAIEHHHQSVLVVIDNAEFIANQGLSALWQAIHEFSRVNQSNLTFNVLLIGDTKWAKPLHHGLKNKSDSRVAEFLVPTLTKQQATDFMMSVHADWSDQKIQQFVNKVPLEYLIPKQLIYAQLPNNKKTKFKVFLFLGAMITFLAIAATVVAFYLRTSEPVIEPVEIPQVQLDATNQKKPIELNEELPLNRVDKALVGSDAELPSESQQLLEPVTELQKTEESSSTIEQPTNIEAVDETSTIKTKASILEPSVESKIVNAEQNDVTLQTQSAVTYLHDEQKLLKIEVDRYSLMLGGFSKFESLESVKSSFIATDEKLKFYQTIRDSKPWYVLLYGDFSTSVEANNYVDNNLPTFEKMSPWAKSFQSIREEINVTTRQLENNDNDNN